MVSLIDQSSSEVTGSTVYGQPMHIPADYTMNDAQGANVAQVPQGSFSIFWHSTWTPHYQGVIIFQLHQQKGQAPRVRNGCYRYTPQQAPQVQVAAQQATATANQAPPQQVAMAIPAHPVVQHPQQAAVVVVPQQVIAGIADLPMQGLDVQLHPHQGASDEEESESKNDFPMDE